MINELFIKGKLIWQLNSNLIKTLYLCIKGPTLKTIELVGLNLKKISLIEGSEHKIMFTEIDFQKVFNKV